MAFTKNYAKYWTGTGSLLAEGVNTDAICSGKIQYIDDITTSPEDAVPNMATIFCGKLRFFTPEEAFLLMGFRMRGACPFHSFYGNYCRDVASWGLSAENRNISVSGSQHAECKCPCFTLPDPLPAGGGKLFDDEQRNSKLWQAIGNSLNPVVVGALARRHLVGE